VTGAAVSATCCTVSVTGAAGCGDAAFGAEVAAGGATDGSCEVAAPVPGSAAAVAGRTTSTSPRRMSTAAASGRTKPEFTGPCLIDYLIWWISGASSSKQRGAIFRTYLASIGA
jgi:hypothetical protein